MSEQTIHDLLSDEILAVILSFVPPMDLLRSTSLVSKRFSNVLSQDFFWRSLLSNGEKKTSFANLNKHQIQRYYLWYAAVALKQGIPSCLGLTTVLTTWVHARQTSNGRTCAASTTDHTNEAIENVLSYSTEGFRRWRDGGSWWSSRPTPRPDSEDTLLFTTRFPTSLMLNVRIKPLRDPFNNRDVYTWNQTVLRAYYLTEESSSDLNVGFPCSFRGDNRVRALPPTPRLRFAGPANPDREYIEKWLKGHTPVYQSDPLPVRRYSSDMIRYNLPPGVVANVLTVTLVGKNAEQFQGSGYYACVEHFDCRGIPLYEDASQVAE